MNTQMIGQIGQGVVYGAYCSLGLVTVACAGCQLINCDWRAFAKDTAATVKNTAVQVSKIAVSTVIPLGLAYCVNDYYKGTYNEYSAVVPYGLLLLLSGFTYCNLFSSLN
jgi:ABC-type xylose transport system permease subunit